jgi:hypothetical protein
VEEVFRHLAEERSWWTTAVPRSEVTADELDVPAGVRLVIGRGLRG